MLEHTGYIDENIIEHHKKQSKEKTFFLFQEGAKKNDKPSKKLNKEEVKEIRRLYYDEGLSITEIFQQHPFINSYNTISNIVHYKSWKDVI